MAKVKTKYECQECGFESAKHMGRCPECLAWNCFLETTESAGKNIPSAFAVLEAATKMNQNRTTPMAELLADLNPSENYARYSTGFEEFDRVLGGGILPGAYVLLGGDPGIGKSTIMLQLADVLAQAAKTVLYVSGEESPSQLKHRADRMQVKGQTMRVLANTNLEAIIQDIQLLAPDIVIIDSIQSIYSPHYTGTPGSVGQIRECATALMQVAKTLNVTIFLIGHVTKDGNVAGPKLLEHTVDTVLYLEGESSSGLRLLRSVKNRFGSTNEIGVFEMQASGMQEMKNPSAWFLSERGDVCVAGSAVACTMEGTRPLLIEIQALVAQSAYSAPSRTANGLDKNRLHQILAILERRVGLDFSRQDVYVNVVGGYRIQEPAADLAIAMSLISSLRDLPLKCPMVICGELGLTGEVRSVPKLEARLKEAEKLGFEAMVLPPIKALEDDKQKKQKEVGTMRVCEVKSLLDTIPNCFNAPNGVNGGDPTF